MFDFFAILSKGGIVIWYIQNTKLNLVNSVNGLIKSVILSEHGGTNPYVHNELALKYFMDNEFQLLFVVAYQKVLQLSYVDKFLDTLHLAFRDQYRQDLLNLMHWRSLKDLDFSDFTLVYDRLLQEAELEAREEANKTRVMRTFEESQKSKKTVSSMVVTNEKDKSLDTPSPGPAKKGKKGAKKVAEPVVPKASPGKNVEEVMTRNSPVEDDKLDVDLIQKNRDKLFGRKKPPAKSAGDEVSNSPSGGTSKTRKKMATKWGNSQVSAEEMSSLDYSRGTSLEKTSSFGGDRKENGSKELDSLKESEIREMEAVRGRLHPGQVDTIDASSDEEDDEEVESRPDSQKSAGTKTNGAKSGSGGGMFGLFRTLVTGGSATGKLTREVMQPILEQLRDRLIDKNVASEVAQRLCDSVCERLVGSQLGTFERVQSRVRSSLEEACTQLLQPKRRVDVLRDVLEAKRQGRPYVIVFCGVNGVGKSTNLAKIACWLIEQNLRVLIVAGDTFRSGAVEQLRVHVRKLNYLFPAEDQPGGQSVVELYERGYGKDAAGIAMSGVCHARSAKFDVVLVDTTGRMQDNQPLMQALSKLINVNQPDLVLFVGEALVGNEAVDQLVKFNQALVDNAVGEPRTIDGIVLTKFDTIDDKVGAAISMTYISGQPILFVGTGQTYADLRQLSASAVVKALMK